MSLQASEPEKTNKPNLARALHVQLLDDWDGKAEDSNVEHEVERGVRKEESPEIQSVPVRDKRVPVGLDRILAEEEALVMSLNM